MCTLSWRPLADGYEVFFNRDERRQRLPAGPPRLIEDHSPVRRLAPRDGDFGGSWIAVNDRGVTIALLNRYQDARHEGPGPFTSRGLLVLELAAAGGPEEISRAMAVTDLEAFRAFTLVALAPGRPARQWIWDARSLAPRDDIPPPLVSSGYDPEGAEKYRVELFEEMVGPDPEHHRLLAFHRSHRPEQGPLSPCMHRPDAATVSLTWIEVTPQQVAMAYAAGPPCRHELAPPLVLSRHELP